jgi:lauroyl/myristoyl acyltransferase
VAREGILAEHFLNVPKVYKIGTKWIRYVPPFLSYALSQIIADISYVFYKPAVKNLKKNLRCALPLISEEELSSLARRLLRNYSKYLVDYGRFTGLNKKNTSELISCFDGKENLEAALKMNRGLILLTAHLGNWELGGIFFGSYGITTNVVTLPDENPEIDSIRRWYRELYGVKTITIDNSPFSTIEMIKALNNREAIAILIDRYNSRQNNTTVDFFNKPTLFPRGPLTLSRLTGAPIVVAFVVREKGGYKGVVEKLFMVPNEKEEYKVLTEVVKILERYIIMYPDQWYNFTPIIRAAPSGTV